MPTDFSENAQKAINFALALFANEECIFYIMHAYHDVPSAPGNKLTAKEELIQVVENLQSNDNRKHRFEWVLESDSVINLTNRTIIDKAVNYVIMGTKGSSAIKEIFIGSNSLSIIKHLNRCPIIVVPSDYEYESTQEILFVTDFKHYFKEYETEPLIDISQLNSNTINVAHIKTSEVLNDTQELNKKLLRNTLKDIKQRFFEVEPLESVAATVFQFKKENKRIGMVALLNTKHGFFESLMREPVLKNIAFKTQVPLLVLPLVD